ncbi:2-methylcitrate dehydratase PrpD [Polyplosphaeria fusca]|uniref:2-methylcitrate dehydratase PrpD n=1 Tax=Polyplosphaeria fusca TaxID=682080 RepID=A0A9P4UV67_9PLEO|nr:2-methylcitrate dehydratase PrpD [Polyplosphaeria fusca]
MPENSNNAANSLARILENSVTRPQLGEWLASPSADIHARLVSLSSEIVDGSDSRVLSFNESLVPAPHSVHSKGSSMSVRSKISSTAPRARVRQSNPASEHPPSLHNYSEATPTETTISTGLASRLSGVPLLEEVAGNNGGVLVLERRLNQIRRPTFECSFWFLSCSGIFDHQNEWITHTLSHFRGEEPPKTVTCPLCDEFTSTCENGWKSWQNRQDHVASHHLQGMTLRTSRPDFHLFQHLWQKRLIDDQDLKELKGGNHNLTRPPIINKVTNIRRGRGARESSSGYLRRAAYESTMQPSSPARDNRLDLEQTSVNHQKYDLPSTINAQQSSIAVSIPENTESSMEQQGHARQRSHHSTSSCSDPRQSSPSLDNKDETSSTSIDPPCDSNSVEDSVVPNISNTLPNSTKEKFFTQLLHSFFKKQRQSFNECGSGQKDDEQSEVAKGKRRAASPPSNDGSGSKSSKASRKNPPTNRNRDDDEDEDNDDEAGEVPPGPKTGNLVKKRLFACPFVKRYPRCYLKCFSHTLKDISRVKQHLARDKTHRLPIYCSICNEIFDNETLRDSHTRRLQCEKKPAVEWQGIAEVQRGQLSRRSASARTPEANWFEIFEILFPGDPLPVDPYIDAAFSGELRAFREHLLSEGRQIWQDVLTTQLPEHLRQYIEELQTLYDSFYTESIVRLCESWHVRSPNEVDIGIVSETARERAQITSNQTVQTGVDHFALYDQPVVSKPTRGLWESVDLEQIEQQVQIVDNISEQNGFDPGLNGPSCFGDRYDESQSGGQQVMHFDVPQLHHSSRPTPSSMSHDNNAALFDTRFPPESHFENIPRQSNTVRVIEIQGPRLDLQRDEDSQPPQGVVLTDSTQQGCPNVNSAQAPPFDSNADIDSLFDFDRLFRLHVSSTSEGRFGCAIGGFAFQPAPQIALQTTFSAFSGPPTSSILGANGSIPQGLADAQVAVFVNGIASHVEDYDDTHLETIIHPAGPVASALFAIAEAYSPVSGKDFVTAFVAGVEAERKLGLSVSPEHYDVGWHITSTVGSVGAAVGVGKLLGLNTTVMQQAIGIAATQVVGMQGFFGSLQGLEAKYGWLHVVNTRGNATAYFDQLGSTWEIEKNTFKPYPCGIVMHPTIDAAIQLSNETRAKGHDISDVKSVELRMNPEVLILTGKKNPQTGLEGKFSISHAAAIGLLYGEGTPSQFTNEVVNNATVVEMRKKVNVTEDESVPKDAAFVTLEFADGEKLEKHVEHAKGSVENPLSDAELKKKFMEQVALAIGPERAGRAFEAFTGIGGMGVAKIRGLY